MRNALILLLMLAVAAIPGSLVPQRSADPNGVRVFFDRDPALAGFYDALQLFDVYTSVWFSAIYILLFVSLIGCVLPRAVDCGAATTGCSSTLDTSTDVADANRHVPGGRSCTSTGARTGTGEAGGPEMGASLSQRVALRALNDWLRLATARWHNVRLTSHLL
jgi:hypothetical protein